jgi:leucyl aminopeptidase
MNWYTKKAKNATPILLIELKDYNAWLKQQDTFIRNYLVSTNFSVLTHDYILLPNAQGQRHQVLVLLKEGHAPSEVLGALPYQLPEGSYKLDEKLDERYILGWALGTYRFTRYKKNSRLPATLYMKQMPKELISIVESIYWVRDLINTPAQDMSPRFLSQAAKKLAISGKARFQEIAGENLLKKGFPAVHAVGRAAADAPRFVELTWGSPKHPKISVLGKGICFDSGGLDLKTAGGMRLMKKDMGGAAHALGLAKLVMDNQLPVYLQVLIPAAENAIGANAFRPGDVITMRNGKTVEIDNTDAEGRLVLADALAYAVEGKKPEIIIDFATLTGAARVALGTEIGVYFSNNDTMAKAFEASALQVDDPVWRLPLVASYKKQLKSSIADLVNSGDGYGGAITAALFLEAFVEAGIPWFHFDIMAWNLSTRPAHPEGGEAMGLQAMYYYLKTQFKRR